MIKCPDPTANPDYCALCLGWGHKCSEWLRTHSPEQAAEVSANNALQKRARARSRRLALTAIARRKGAC